MWEVLSKEISYLLEKDVKLIRQAFELASKAHEDQKRLSGEPYITHLVEVAKILAQLKLDSTTIAAALLHDVLEDTQVKEADLQKEFGEEIVFLVKGATKISKLPYQAGKSNIENFRKLLLAMAEDIRVVLIKIADRLHNIRTIKYHKPADQRRICQKTMEIYTPLASRLGMGNIKSELEDLCFPVLHPNEYKWLLKQIGHKYEDRIEYLKKVEPILAKELKKENINILQLDFRAKHHWSLYKKLQKYDMDFSKIYDLVAFRIIVPAVTDCYGALGVIHKLWKPLPGRIKDFIATPKPNGYQSLHTTVFCIDGIITEFQIRTIQMHKESETGVAAHWARDEAGKKDLPKSPHFKKLAWVEQLRDWQKENHGSRAFLESLRIDFFKDRIFVFTPKGDVIDLPEGATTVDFAYRIHSELGDQCVGAKINDKLVALNEQLQNGDVVDILIQKNKKPSRDWLKFVKTSEAKRRIKQALGLAKSPKPNASKKFQLKLKVSDRTGMVKDIGNIFSRNKTNIDSLNTQRTKEDIFILIDFFTQNKQSLKSITSQLKKTKGVVEITSLPLD
ncbi:RelA/SpoT family protein [Candidatus Parcubacteria bacterium]|nr:MAG: RelA/SpoT family protein [Candidatus Parcubacteria bacterium]